VNAAAGVRNLADSACVHGLDIVAMAVVAQAVWGVARNLCPDRERATIPVGAAIFGAVAATEVSAMPVLNG
jgi:chromate transporter